MHVMLKASPLSMMLRLAPKHDYPATYDATIAICQLTAAVVSKPV